MMKKTTAKFLLVVGLLCLPNAASAGVIYDQDFESFATGTVSPDGWWKFDGDSNYINTVWEAQPYSGSQSLVYGLDGAAAFGTSWYWYAGVGRSDIAASALGQAAADVTLSLDLAVVGAVNTTPLSVRVSQWDGVAESWSSTWNPTLTTDGSFTSVSVTLDTGTQTGTYNPTYGLSINSIAFNNDGFGLDDGNLVIIDNVHLETIPEPATIGLFGLALTAMLVCRTNRS